MRTLTGLGLIAFAAAAAYGQRGPGRARPGEGPSVNAGASRAARRPALTRPIFPLYTGAYDYGYDYAPAPNVIVLPASPPPPYVMVQEAPAPPVQPEIREYAPPSFEAPAGEAPPAFALALKDGSVRSAVAVSVDHGALHYVDTEGRHERLALESVDRDRTARLNRERNLQLRIPAPSR